MTFRPPTKIELSSRDKILKNSEVEKSFEKVSTKSEKERKKYTLNADHLR